MLRASFLVLVFLQGPVGGPQHSRADWPEFGPSALVQTVHVACLTPSAPEEDERIRRRWGTFIDLGRYEMFTIWPGSFYERKRGKLVLRAGVETRTYRNLRIDGRYPYGVTVWFLERERVFFLEGHADLGEAVGMLGPFVGDPRTELPRAVGDVTGVGDHDMASIGRLAPHHPWQRPN